jgi:tetratricopeptide (TPR) repeat protein
MVEEDRGTPLLSDLRAAAEQARAALDWDRAIALYGQVLEGAALESEDRYELLESRAECYRKLGHYDAQLADLEAMGRLAGEMGDRRRLAGVMKLKGRSLVMTAQFAEARACAEAVLELAQQLGEPALEAAGLGGLADGFSRQGEHARAWDVARQALSIEHDDLAVQAEVLWLLGYVAPYVGQAASSEDYLKRSLELYRALGDREGEGYALNVLSLWCPDLALRRKYLEQALAAFQMAGKRDGLYLIYNNLAMAYTVLGLYGRARDHAERAVAYMRQINERLHLCNYLETLAALCLAQGDLAQARSALGEGLALAQELGLRDVECVNVLDLGVASLRAGRPAEARDLLAKAAELGMASATSADQATPK